MSEGGIIPPPPPVPPTSVSTSKKGQISAKSLVVENLLRLSKENGQESVANLIQQQCCDVGCSESIYLSQIVDVNTKVQDGPRCGLVALEMACEMLQLPVTDIFHSAKSQLFTKQGEMFSAVDMKQLAQSVTGFNGCALERSTVSDFEEAILNSLFKQRPVLIPYDRDHNNSPCRSKGHRAHWAVLTGFVLELSSLPEDMIKNCHMDTKNSSIYHLHEPVDISSLKQASIIGKHIYVYAKQGKSLRTHLWRLDTLLDSNAQLHELDPAIEQDIENYIVKKTDLSDLRDKVVVLWKDEH